MIEPNQVLYEHVETGEADAVPADRVALAVGWRPRGDTLANDLPGREVVVVGDASRPADFVAAIETGAAAALAL